MKGKVKHMEFIKGKKAIKKLVDIMRDKGCEFPEPEDGGCQIDKQETNDEGFPVNTQTLYVSPAEIINEIMSRRGAENVFTMEVVDEEDREEVIVIITNISAIDHNYVEHFVIGLPRVYR